jgi:hypothetical protein
LLKQAIGSYQAGRIDKAEGLSGAINPFGASLSKIDTIAIGVAMIAVLAGGCPRM